MVGSVVLPGDKSISHRAVILGSIADGTSVVHNYLVSDDISATIQACRKLGVRIEQFGTDSVEINGVGLNGLKTPTEPLDLGNSGTSIRLLSGVLTGAGISTVLTGDASLCKRPMGRIVEPLQSMGANIAMSERGTAPLKLLSRSSLKPIDYELPVASAQVKSALLLAGLYAEGVTRLFEPALTRDHTERMFRAFGVSLEITSKAVAIKGRQRLKSADIAVPADLSAAAFFIVGATIGSGSELFLPSVGLNPTRTGVIDILRAMGARIIVSDLREIGGEPVANLSVSSSNLHGIEIPRNLIPSAIDEFPAILVAAASAQGRTVLRGASELRHKESDRIAVMGEGLIRLGIKAETFEDGIVVEGGKINGGEIDAHADHRIAMAFALAGLRSSGPLVVRNASAISTSYPAFLAVIKRAGLRVEQ